MGIVDGHNVIHPDTSTLVGSRGLGFRVYHPIFLLPLKLQVYGLNLGFQVHSKGGGVQCS